MGAGRRRCSWCLAPVALALGLTGCRGPDVLGPDYSRLDRHVVALRDELWRGEVGRPTRQSDDDPGAVQTVSYRQPAAPGAARRLHAETVGDPAAPGRALQLRIEPRDADGRPVPVTANLRVGVVQADPGSGAGKLLGSWDFSAEQLSACWDVQWAGAGYTVILPPQTFSSVGPVRVVARMTLADHSRLEAVLELPWRAPARAAVPVAGGQGVQGVRPAAGWEPPPLRQAFKLMPPVPLE